MKKVVTNNSQSEINLGGLVGREIVAYKSKNSEGVCILANTGGGKYGFVPLNGISSDIRFRGDNFFQAIEKASQVRDVYVFDSLTELANFMLKNYA